MTCWNFAQPNKKLECHVGHSEQPNKKIACQLGHSTQPCQVGPSDQP